MYRDRFNSLNKADYQTQVMYLSSLRALLDGYLEARHVKTIDELKELLLSDRIKATLPVGILRYILSVEAKLEKGWMDSYELAESIDNYQANHVFDTPKSGSVTFGVAGQQQVNKPKLSPNWKPQFNATNRVNSKPVTGFVSKSDTENKQAGKSGCWLCGSTNHFRKNCPERAGPALTNRNPGSNRVSLITATDRQEDLSTLDSNNLGSQHDNANKNRVNKTDIVDVSVNN